jgi:prepilin peptidase CpaA
MPHGWLSFIAPASLFAGAGLLLLAALHDIIARTVPNGVSVLLALAGLGARIMDSNVLVGAAAAAAVFFVAAFLWRRGWMGGGDVKLIGATALVVPPHHVFSFIVAMSVSGSILAALYLVAGRVARRNKPVPEGRSARPVGLLPRAVRAELWRMRRGGPLPYACAIAAGFFFVQF